MEEFDRAIHAAKVYSSREGNEQSKSQVQSAHKKIILNKHITKAPRTMSNETEPITASILLREEEELTGALLPVATQIGEEAAPLAAVPVSQFDYAEAIANEEGLHQEQIAYSIPQKSGGLADDSRENVKRAERAGLIAAEQEREAVQRANQKVYAKDYYARRAMEEANRIARQRDREGLDVNLQEEVDIKLPSNKDTEPKEKRSGYKVGGYEMQEYQFGTDYETNEYETSEYKSVYD